MHTITVGDRVGYARRFLKSIHARATDELWFWQGTVTAITPAGIALVRWDHGAEGGAHPANLARIGSAAYAAD